MVRAAALRPINVLLLAIGTVGFILTLAWWIPPLTLITYVALVFLAARNPLFQRRVLQGRGIPAIAPGFAEGQDISPERRARWLARGETRQKVEAALVVYRKVLTAIEESDDVTRAVLDDAIPKLHAAANRLVDVAQAREKATEGLQDLRRRTAPDAESGAPEESLPALEDRIRAADAEISGTFDKFLTLRARVVRVSIESGDATRADALNASLDELNARLEALSDTMSPPGGTTRG
jgi:ribosome-associated translation inhibitor RaiA